MTCIDQHIEELNAELRACIDPQEQIQIAEELAIAKTERAEMVAAQEGTEPPF